MPSDNDNTVFPVRNLRGIISATDSHGYVHEGEVEFDGEDNRLVVEWKEHELCFDATRLVTVNPVISARIDVNPRHSDGVYYTARIPVAKEEPNFLSVVELRNVADILSKLNNLGGKQVSFGKIKLLDSNGETIGHAKWKLGEYVFTSGVFDD